VCVQRAEYLALDFDLLGKVFLYPVHAGHRVLE